MGEGRQKEFSDFAKDLGRPGKLFCEAVYSGGGDSSHDFVGKRDDPLRVSGQGLQIAIAANPRSGFSSPQGGMDDFRRVVLTSRIVWKAC